MLSSTSAQNQEDFSERGAKNMSLDIEAVYVFGKCLGECARRHGSDSAIVTLMTRHKNTYLGIFIIEI
jgi:hypothetical protein